MQTETKRPRDLTPRELQCWQAALAANPALDSPYFRSEFAQLVDRVRDDVRITVISKSGQPAAFFPFQRAGRVGKPLAGRLSDFQALIAEPNFSVDPCWLVQQSRLSAWDFDHLLTTQADFHGFHRFRDLSPFIDLSGGFSAYEHARKKLGGEELRQTQRKSRKLAREIGPLRLVAMSRDASVLEQTLAWKSEQYRNTQITDVFNFPWTAELMRQLLDTSQASFGGSLSALYAGSQLVACHMGMRSGGVLHYWFPTYNARFAEYSPGRVLLLELCRECESLGLQRIDLGRGLSNYEKRVMSGLSQVAVGSVDLRPMSRVLRAGWRQTRDWVRQSPLSTPAQTPAHVLYRLKEWIEFR